MANIKSAKKNIRKTRTRTLRNRAVKSKLRTLSKQVEKAATASDAQPFKAAVACYISALDKAAKRKIIHRNKARRHSAACAKLLAAAATKNIAAPSHGKS